MKVKCNGYTDGVNLHFYPDTLKLKLSFNNAINVDFLDLSLKIRNNNLIPKIYDKRDNYNFDAIKVLYFSSGVHISVFKNIFLNNLRWIERKCSEISIKVIKRLNRITSIESGFPKRFLISGFLQMKHYG